MCQYWRKANGIRFNGYASFFLGHGQGMGRVGMVGMVGKAGEPSLCQYSGGDCAAAYITGSSGGREWMGGGKGCCIAQNCVRQRTDSYRVAAYNGSHQGVIKSGPLLRRKI